MSSLTPGSLTLNFRDWDDDNFCSLCCVCSILVYESEPWTLRKDVKKALNDVNVNIFSMGITEKTSHEEVTTDMHTFNLLRWIRTRRM